MSKQTLEETLQYLAEISNFFTINPEYDKTLHKIRKEVNHYKALVGVYEDKQKLDRAIAEADKKLNEAERTLSDAKVVEKTAKQLKADLDGVVKQRVKEQTASLEKELKESLSEAKEEVSALKAQKKDLDSVLVKGKKDHDRREEKLTLLKGELDTQKAQLENATKDLAKREQEFKDKRAQIAEMI